MALFVLIAEKLGNNSSLKGLGLFLSIVFLTSIISNDSGSPSNLFLSLLHSFDLTFLYGNDIYSYWIYETDFGKKHRKYGIYLNRAIKLI